MTFYECPELQLRLLFSPVYTYWALESLQEGEAHPWVFQLKRGAIIAALIGSTLALTLTRFRGVKNLMFLARLSLLVFPVLWVVSNSLRFWGFSIMVVILELVLLWSRFWKREADKDYLVEAWLQVSEISLLRTRMVTWPFEAYFWVRATEQVWSDGFEVQGGYPLLCFFFTCLAFWLLSALFSFLPLYFTRQQTLPWLLPLQAAAIYELVLTQSIWIIFWYWNPWWLGACCLISLKLLVGGLCLSQPTTNEPEQDGIPMV